MAEITVTAENFQAEVLKSDKPVLLDFWATWCGPCMMASPIVEEIANEYEGKIKVGKVNVDDEPTLAGIFGVVSIPTFVVIKNGKPAKSAVGLMPKEELVKLIENN